MQYFTEIVHQYISLQNKQRQFELSSHHKIVTLKLPLDLLPFFKERNRNKVYYIFNVFLQSQAQQEGVPGRHGLLWNFIRVLIDVPKFSSFFFQILTIYTLNLYCKILQQQCKIMLSKSLQSKKCSHSHFISVKLYGIIGKPKILRVATKAYDP